MFDPSNVLIRKELKNYYSCPSNKKSIHITAGGTTYFNSIELAKVCVPKGYVRPDKDEDAIVHETIHLVLDDFISRKVSWDFDNICRRTEGHKIVELCGITLQRTRLLRKTKRNHLQDLRSR